MSIKEQETRLTLHEHDDDDDDGNDILLVVTFSVKHNINVFHSQEQFTYFGLIS